MPHCRPQALAVMGKDVFDAQFEDRHIEKLRSLADFGEHMWAADFDEPAIADRLAEVEVLVTGWGTPPLDEQVLTRLPALRAVFHCAGTVRHLVCDELWRRGIRVTTAADANAVPVAEYTLAAIIFANKKVPFIAADPTERHTPWMQHPQYGALGNLGRTVGLIGFSRVGRLVTNKVQQLEATRCLVSDPYADARAVAAAGGELVPLAQMLPELDVLSIHAPELPSTYHMIGARELAALPDHATVINTARGSLVDTDALERECLSGRINAILDVADPEPLPVDSPLFALPNVLVSPHLAGSLGTEVYRMTDAMLRELSHYVAGEPLESETTSEEILLSA